MENVFVKPNDHYRSQVDPGKNYIRFLTTFFKLKYRLTEDEAKKRAIEVTRSTFKDKTVEHFERLDNGDRVVKHTSLFKYIDNTIKEGRILAPTFTTYISKQEEKSILSEFIAENVARRSVAKKAAQKAKMEGDNETAVAKNNEQSMMKIYNNSLSGSFAQESCILHNPTSHSTLTSVTRSMSSLANTSNEKIIAGNRYYPTIEDVLNDVVYIVSNTDIRSIKMVVDRFNLHLPTVEETVQVLRYSSDTYFKDLGHYDTHVVPLLTNMSGYERAAVAYVNDLHHIRVYNPDFMRTFLDSLSEKIIRKENNPELIPKIYALDENILNFVHTLFFEEIKGFGKDYEKMNEVGLASCIYYTSLNVLKVLQDYKDFIEVMFMSRVMPFNSHRIRNMVRRTVVLSDTDSTCFTVDKWVEWYNGSIEINSKTIGIGAAVAFISTQVIVHLLAQLSANLNIDKNDIGILAMKNEFLWTVHIPAEVSKHYLAYTVMQEGNVYPEPDLEIKGVHLKNSAVPTAIIKDAKAFMMDVLETVHNNGKIRIKDAIKRVINIEEMIKDKVAKADSEFFKKSKIKNKEAYALDEFTSPYHRHTFWTDVFEDKYGPVGEPPYDVIKIPTILDRKTQMKKWLETITDEALRTRLHNWLVKYRKNVLPTIYLDATYVKGSGIPAEIMSVIDIKKIILEITKQHRIILECLGLVINEDKLISEQFRVC